MVDRACSRGHQLADRRWNPRARIFAASGNIPVADRLPSL